MMCLWIWGTMCYDWVRKKCYYGIPGMITIVPLYEVVSTTCRIVMMAWLEDPLEVADSTASPGSKATQGAGVSRLTMLGQPPRELPGRMAGDHLQWKDTNRSTLSRMSCQEGHTSLRWSKHDGGTELILRWMKPAHHPKWKDKSWGQYGIVVPFARATKDIAERPLRVKVMVVHLEASGMGSLMEGTIWYDIQNQKLQNLGITEMSWKHSLQ
jgi:hypothetical protein